MANHSTVPKYCSATSLQYAKTLIKNPPQVWNQKKNSNESKFYEHLVASWGCTMSNLVFTGDGWMSTPERRDNNSKKIPDWSVHKLYFNKKGQRGAKPHMLGEYKSAKGDRFEKALAQTVHEFAETMDEVGLATGQYEVYIVVQRGTKIGFFEYHNDISFWDGDIPTFRNCTSLTQDYEVDGIMTTVLEDKPDDMEPLYYDTKYLKKLQDKDEQAIREEAAEYEEPCVLDLDKHEDQINFLYHHILNNEPRTSAATPENSQNEESILYKNMHLHNRRISYQAEESSSD